jgi:gliding motility-associated-like protein
VNASPPETTTFTIKGTDLNGCADTTQIILEVIDCSLTIPNVFTPNSDGKNDVFNLEYKGLKDYYLRIFNRWGKQVYESGDKTRFWDGTINGTEAATGVYFYILLIEEKSYSGSVSLFR